MKEVILEASLREISTKHHLKSLRLNGMVPAVFYGHNEKPIHLTVDGKKFDAIVHAGGSNVLVNLKIGADINKTAILKEVQRDILSQKPIHIDFQSISLKDMIEVSVPMHIVGIAPGVKLSGGVLEHVVREAKIRCLPIDIPQFINVDVSTLQINQSIAIKDLPEIKGIEFISDPNSIIVNIVSPTILEEAPAAAAGTGAAGAEPEVISKGKKDKEEGAAATDKKADAGKEKK